MIDWSKPIETLSGEPAKVVWPAERNMKTVEIHCGRWSYNLDGTPMRGGLMRLRNSTNQGG